MPKLHPLAAVAAAVVVIAALALARGVLVPIALAVVLSLLLAPLVRGVQRVGVSRTPAVLVVVVAFAAACAGVGLVVTQQVVGLTRELPRYRSNIEAKLSSLKPVGRVVNEVEHVAKEIGKRASAEPAPREPVKVEVVDSGPDQLTRASGALGPLIEAAGTAAIALLLVTFFLVYQSDIVDRIIRLAGPRQITITTRTLHEAAHGVSRYLFTLALVNGGFGLIMGLGLLLLGVPNALLWGLIAALLRFLPYVGPIVGCSLPVLLSLAVFEGWTVPLFALGFIVSLELALNYAIEPFVYGSRTGLSPLAVILSALAWGWLWGPLGLLLSVPLTVCLAALGKTVPSLRFLSVLLGNEPPIEAPVALYHRLLATHYEQALDLLERDRDGRTLEATFDRLLVPVLLQASTDVERGDLDSLRAAHVFESVRQLAGELADEPAPEVADPEAALEPRTSVLCLPATDPTDELAGELLSHTLARAGHTTTAGALSTLANEKAEMVVEAGAEVVCVAALAPSNLLRLRYLYKRLRLRFPDLTIVVALLGLPERHLDPIAQRVVFDGKGALVTSLAEATAAIDAAARAIAERRRLEAARESA